MKKINRKLLIVIGGILVAISFIAIMIDILATSDWSLIKSARLSFVPITVHKGTIRAQILFPGSIDFSEHAILQFQQIPANGVMISWVGVKTGDSVKKNQLLASLDVQAVQKQQQINLSNYLNQRYTFDQATSDNGGRSPSQAISDTQKRLLQQNQISLDNSVGSVELQDLIKQFSNLYTPIDGIVTKIDTPIAGVNIQTADQAKFEVINPKTMFFNADVEETEVDNLHVGDKGIIVLNAFPSEYIQATITNVAFSPHQDANNNNLYTVKLSLDNKGNEDYKYKFGMGGYVIFHEYNENVVLAPNEYLHTDDNGTYLKVGNARKLIYVQTGITNGKVTEIMKGLSEGDTIYY